MSYARRMRLALPFALALLCACSKPSPPTLVPEQVKITAITPQRIDVKVTVRVINPNTIDLVARDLTAHLLIAGRFDLGTVDIPVTTTLPAGQTTRLEVPLSVKVVDLAPMAQLGMATTKIPYSVDGTVGLGGDLIHVEIPYQLEDTVPRDQVVRAAMNAIPGLH
jgi:LEA14-like dessication related protein